MKLSQWMAMRACILTLTRSNCLGLDNGSSSSMAVAHVNWRVICIFFKRMIGPSQNFLPAIDMVSQWHEFFEIIVQEHLITLMQLTWLSFPCPVFFSPSSS